MNKLEVLYEDNHMIVVYKPANILSQSDITNDLDLLTMVKNYIKEKYQKPGNVYIGLVHRLDRPVEGIMVFAKTSKAAARFSKQIQNHEFQKNYLALVQGMMKEKEGTFCDYLEKQENGNTIVTDEKNGKKSVLTYQVMQEKDGISFVSIQLITGRHHQIRVQFASRGYPLVGENRYSKSSSQKLYLCCSQLSFLHPITKERFVFQRYPQEGLWKKFLK